MMKSCALFRAANLEILDYPFDAALESAMAICDEAVVVVGQSQDNTVEWVNQLARQYRGRVRIAHAVFVFDLGWQERWWDLAISYTDAEWLLWLDADEVIDPAYAPKIRERMFNSSVSLIRFPFVHFYATADYQIDFALRHNTRLGRRSAGYRMRNWNKTGQKGVAACQVVVMENGKEVNAHNRETPALVNVDFPILHYGWCRNPIAMAQSQRKQTAWYRDGDGLENGHIPDVAPYDFKLARQLETGRAKRYAGSHPECVQRWIGEHRAQWDEIMQRTESQVLA